MEGVRVKGDSGAGSSSGQDDADKARTTGSSGQDDADKARTTSGGGRAARSVISINKTNVTITSTGKDGKDRAAKVTTAPLRSPHDPALTGNTSVSTLVKDTQLVTALTQQFRAGGALTVPPGGSGGSRSAPCSSASSSRGSVSHSRSSSGSGGVTEDLTSKLSALLLQQQQVQQQQQQKQQQQQQSAVSQKNGCAGEERQQNPEEESVPSPSSPTPPEVVNGTPNGWGSGASSPDIPPPPPPSALMRSINERPQLRKVDASYTPRPKSYSTQNSAATGNGNPPQAHNKHDLMAALTAVVSSGSPVAGLRKTRGPGRGGGVTEVFTSRRSTGRSTPGAPGAPATAHHKEN